MCQYCGCREVPLLADYTAEHERVINAGGDAVRALDAGDISRAHELAAQMSSELATHWRGEEDGLFAQLLATEDGFDDFIAPLITEHRDLAEFLHTMDLHREDDQSAFRSAVFELHEHIAKEEDSLFPASMISLDGDQWDAAIDAWQRAHPGARMLLS